MVKKSSPRKLESVQNKMENVERMAYVSLWMAIVFLSIYVIFCVSDDLYAETDTTTTSKGFLYNVITLLLAFGLVMTLYYDPSESGNGFYLKMALATGLLVFVGLSGHELRHNLDSSGTSKEKEEASQFVLSVIGLVFALFGGFAVFLNVAMRRYV